MLKLDFLIYTKEIYKYDVNCNVFKNSMIMKIYLTNN